MGWVTNQREARRQQKSPAEVERQRILEAYARREAAVPQGRYGEGDVVNRWMIEERERLWRILLADSGAVPDPQWHILDVGCGFGDHLAALASEGRDVSRLAGVDLIAERVESAQRKLPNANIRLANGDLPFGPANFDLLFAYTVFSSILSEAGRRALASGMIRATAPSGHIVIYDFRYPNPANRDTRPLTLGQIRRLFPGWPLVSRPCTLLPPLARRLFPTFPQGARALSKLPFLLSHRVTLLRNPTQS